MKQLSELKQELINLILDNQYIFYFSANSNILIPLTDSYVDVYIYNNIGTGDNNIIKLSDNESFSVFLEMLGVDTITKNNYLLNNNIYQPILITEILNSLNSINLLQIYNAIFNTNYEFYSTLNMVEDDLTVQDEDE